VPRCCGSTAPRNPWSQHGGECTRRGVVFAGVRYGREYWYCLQHDPKRADEKRVADLAPVLLELVREAVERMPRTKAAQEWRERAQVTLAKAEGR
jgi:hypothetical protein